MSKFAESVIPPFIENTFIELNTTPGVTHDNRLQIQATTSLPSPIHQDHFYPPAPGTHNYSGYHFRLVASAEGSTGQVILFRIGAGSALVTSARGCIQAGLDIAEGELFLSFESFEGDYLAGKIAFADVEDAEGNTGWFDPTVPEFTDYEFGWSVDGTEIPGGFSGLSPDDIFVALKINGVDQTLNIAPISVDAEPFANPNQNGIILSRDNFNYIGASNYLSIINGQNGNWLATNHWRDGINNFNHHNFLKGKIQYFAARGVRPDTPFKEAYWTAEYAVYSGDWMDNNQAYGEIFNVNGENAFGIEGTGTDLLTSRIIDEPADDGPTDVLKITNAIGTVGPYGDFRDCSYLVPDKFGSATQVLNNAAFRAAAGHCRILYLSDSTGTLDGGNGTRPIQLLTSKLTDKYGLVGSGLITYSQTIGSGYARTLKTNADNSAIGVVTDINLTTLPYAVTPRKFARASDNYESTLGANTAYIRSGTSSDITITDHTLRKDGTYTVRIFVEVQDSATLRFRSIPVASEAEITNREIFTLDNEQTFDISSGSADFTEETGGFGRIDIVLPYNADYPVPRVTVDSNDATEIQVIGIEIFDNNQSGISLTSWSAGGVTSMGQLARFNQANTQALLKLFEPDLVIANIGANDVSGNVSSGHTARNILKLYRVCNAVDPNVQFLTTTWTPRDRFEDNSLVQYYNFYTQATEIYNITGVQPDLVANNLGGVNTLKRLQEDFNWRPRRNADEATATLTPSGLELWNGGADESAIDNYINPSPTDFVHYNTEAGAEAFSSVMMQFFAPSVRLNKGAVPAASQFFSFMETD